MTDAKLNDLISAWLDGRISESQSELLQDRLRESEEAREQFLAMTNLDAGLRQLAGGDRETVAMDLPKVSPVARRETFFSASNLCKIAAAAVLLLVVGLQAYQLGKREAGSDNGVAQQSSEREATIAGYATLRRVAGIEWSDESSAWREGDVLPAGELKFDRGVAEIDFFCGATVIVEGPATLDLESDWSLRLVDGRLRANVPPAARGFIVKVADSEVVDLGTEFVLDVSSDNAWVKVVDGEVKLNGGPLDGEHLTTGESESLSGADPGQEAFRELSTIGDVQRRHDLERQSRLNDWVAESEKLRKDDRLIAYYPIVNQKESRFVTNASAAGDVRDGKLTGSVERGLGRFGEGSNSLAFDRPGSRVRVRIDGKFKQYSFVCWARIDSLEHKYNALFMGDGYENGEPHWQIREDGKLMFSVMVDDTPGSGRGKAPDARLHKIYMTDSVWDVSKSGQWMQLAAVYDPIGRVVRQYVNGKQIFSDTIEDVFFVEELRIGPAEIGNWGQPLRKSPWFAVRNFNGATDELAIFEAALTDEEIKSLYDSGKPFDN